jgi:hypothetical protein
MNWRPTTPDLLMPVKTTRNATNLKALGVERLAGDVPAIVEILKGRRC